MVAPSAPQRLRILHVVTAYYPAVRYGGPIRSVHGLAKALAQRGHEVHVYTTSMDGPGDLDVPLARPVDLEGVAVHYFRVPALRRLFWAPGLGQQLRRTVKGFDLLHIHGVFLAPTATAARIARWADVPYVLSPRGMLGRDVIERKSRWVKSAWLHLIERETLHHAAGLHVTAGLEADEIRALHLPVPGLTRTVPNGLTIPEHVTSLANTPFAALPQRYGLFLSRISWKKGLEPLITAWQAVKDLPLVIAGNDDEGYRPRLERQVQRLGLTGRVHFAGPASDEHKWALYQGAQLFVLPSYSENFGIVVAEAMAMGCPVIVTPEVGIAHLVESSGAGVVTSHSPAALASVVNGLMQDDARRQKLGQRGPAAVRRHLSWERVAEQMEDLYGQALERHRQDRGVGQDALRTQKAGPQTADAGLSPQVGGTDAASGTSVSPPDGRL